MNIISKKIKKELVKYGNLIQEKGLVIGPGGNISAKCNDIIYIKSSGFSFDELEPDDYIGVRIRDGKVIEGDSRPSSEINIHLACYRKNTDINTVVHTHPPYVTSLITAGVKLKPMWPDFVAYVKNVCTLKYIAPGGKKLIAIVEKVIPNCENILLANHGCICAGKTLREAYYKTLIIEEAAKTQIFASLIGKPRFLTQKEVEEIADFEFEKYRKKLLRGN
ncbi:MAG: class II aldolase/adducin family protein [Candidatus Firestonebacteria bacterium]